MNDTALPCWAAISLTPCLKTVCRSAMASGWLVGEVDFVLATAPLAFAALDGTRAAVMPLRIARISGSSRVGWAM
jgi:hypothetical protein